MIARAFSRLQNDQRRLLRNCGRRELHSCVQFVNFASAVETWRQRRDLQLCVLFVNFATVRLLTCSCSANPPLTVQFVNFARKSPIFGAHLRPVCQLAFPRRCFIAKALPCIP